MTNPPGRFPDDMWSHLIDAVAEYASVLKLSQQSDVSDLPALLHQLIEATAGVNRAMNTGTILTEYFERVLGPPPAPPAARADPAVETQYQDDLARWVMQAWQILLQHFLKPIMGGHPMLDSLHNDLGPLPGGRTPAFLPRVGPAPAIRGMCCAHRRDAWSIP